MNSKIIAMEQEIVVKRDIEIQLSSAQKYIIELEAHRDRLQRDLETASDYLLEQEEKTHKAH
jgi:hypothetical protein